MFGIEQWLCCQRTDTAVADSCYLNEGTAAISTVTYERLEKNSSLSLQNSLFGEVLGLTSMQGMNGIWDERASLSIRGLQSLSNNGILILVDGIERPIADLTVEEVESVSVLKMQQLLHFMDIRVLTVLYW